MLLSFKTALIPNNQQVTAFRKASNVYSVVLAAR